MARNPYQLDPFLAQGFSNLTKALIGDPETDLHLFLKGGSRDLLVRHASYADSLLSTDQADQKVRTAVYVHTW